ILDAVKALVAFFLQNARQNGGGTVTPFPTNEPTSFRPLNKKEATIVPPLKAEHSCFFYGICDQTFERVKFLARDSEYFRSRNESKIRQIVRSRL
ncbi:MAG TPA: hypothetical protein PLP21_08120, partial [Pyrinomonadaceae bacterium]|nr:hypothetical protein [Pyrinomonadaceae bacterium]